MNTPNHMKTPHFHDHEFRKKPDAVKVARSVWSGGKAERPYLSLPD
jgi:hypothetical protein